MERGETKQQHLVHGAWRAEGGGGSGGRRNHSGPETPRQSLYGGEPLEWESGGKRPSPSFKVKALSGCRWHHIDDALRPSCGKG